MATWLSNSIATALQDAPGSGQQGGNIMSLILPLALIMVFYFLLIVRPKKKEEEERRRKLEAARKGDRIMTIGGIHGKVVDVDSQRKVATVEVAPKIHMKFSLSAIASVEPKNAPSDKTDGDTDKAESKG